MADGGDSDDDLTKELQPLAYHVSDRKRVLQEALRTLKGKRLEAMIPPALKSWDRDRLEYACLEILEDLSDETMLSILEGRAETAGVAAVEQVKLSKKVSGLKTKKSVLKQLAKSVEDGTTADDEPKKKKKKKVLTEAQNEAKAAKLKKKKKLAKAKAKEKVKKKKKAAAAAETEETSVVVPHKSLMELLELEYRAKAIKALLRSQGQTVPDIPINIDEDSNSNTNRDKVTENDDNIPPAVNGHVGADAANELVPAKKVLKTLPIKPGADHSKRVAPSPAKKQNLNKTNTPVKSADTLATSKSSKPSNTEQSSVTSVPRAGVVQEKSKDVKKKPEKAVIDLIDETLNRSFIEEVETAMVTHTDDIVDNVKPPSVIAEACTRPDVDSEALRRKLLEKYNKQKNRKKKRKPEPELKEQEDILDLHPQELSLTDEERTTNQNSVSCTDDETSESSENEEPIENPTLNEEPSQITEHAQNSKSDEEELIYDDDGSEDDSEVFPGRAPKTQEVQGSEMETEEKTTVSDMSNFTSDDKQVVENEEFKELDQEVGESPVISDNETTKDGQASENSRSGIFSETTRDDVFEAASDGTSFSQALKRKITFRIDPARIGALEEQAAEKEARKVEEQKREEEEQRRLEEERLKENEVEEGEIDSNEEYLSDDGSEKRKSSAPPSPTMQSLKRHIKEDRFQSRKKVKSDENSDDSQDSTSYYSRKRTYDKKTSERDFGICSPKATVVNQQNSEDSLKRSSSPVEFITQFSDMEPISEDDSDHSVSSPKRNSNQKEVFPKPAGNLPVQGCAEMPTSFGKKAKVQIHSDSSNEVEDPVVGNEDSTSSGKEGISEKAASESDEDDEPKPVTWYERWAQSHGMQKVAKTNKIHKKVRTKLKQVVSAKKKPIELPKVEPSVEQEPIIGSIEEYEKLFGKKIITKEPETVDAEVAIEKEGDNIDEDDADDLWGDIIGGS